MLEAPAFPIPAVANAPVVDGLPVAGACVVVAVGACVAGLIGACVVVVEVGACVVVVV